jgi:hypothetical protein
MNNWLAISPGVTDATEFCAVPAGAVAVTATRPVVGAVRRSG